MEIVVTVFLGVWVTACSLIAYRKVKRDLRDVTEREDGKE